MFEKENNIASFVLSETSNSHDVENAMETEINVVEPMDVLDEVIANMDETHRSNATSDLKWVMANHEDRTISGGVSDNDETD